MNRSTKNDPANGGLLTFHNMNNNNEQIESATTDEVAPQRGLLSMRDHKKPVMTFGLRDWSRVATREGGFYSPFDLFPRPIAAPDMVTLTTPCLLCDLPWSQYRVELPIWQEYMSRPEISGIWKDWDAFSGSLAVACVAKAPLAQVGTIRIEYTPLQKVAEDATYSERSEVADQVSYLNYTQERGVPFICEMSRVSNVVCALCASDTGNTKHIANLGTLELSPCTPIQEVGGPDTHKARLRIYCWFQRVEALNLRVSQYEDRVATFRGVKAVRGESS